MAINSSVASNAFNFLNFIQSQVDPRTGQYTCAITLPELKANDLCGPVVPLQLNFNPLNLLDSGFGKGWNLQLSQFNPDSRMVALYTGESFRVDPIAGGVVIPEQKIDSFHFQDLGNRRYRIAHKSGLVEILAVGQGGLAMPVQMFSPEGHSVTLQYTPFGTQPLLSRVLNADGSVLLSLARTTNELKLTAHPGTPFAALFTLNIIGGETTSIVLPTEDQASWRFDYIPLYDLTCLSEVRTPTGGHETVTYSGEPHLFPGLTTRKLPRVQSHVRDPGCGQAPIATHYQYGADDHNFLGYGSDVSWSDEGLDNLYRVKGDYQYETTEILWDTAAKQGLRWTRRVFNRFHLMELEEVRQKAAAGKDDTLLTTETEYYIEPNIPFEDQPAYCQLPRTVTRTWRHFSATVPRHTEVINATYDDFGNLLTQVNANGVTETSEWYKAEGEDGCPADPEGFVRYLKSKTVTPAASDYGNAPVLQTHYRYGEYDGLGGSGKWLALSEEILRQLENGQPKTELRRITHEYLNTPDDTFMHGRKLREVLTLSGKATVIKPTITEYSYSDTLDVRTGTTAMRTVSTLIGYDDNEDKPVRKVIIREHSVLSGFQQRSHDDDQSEVSYQYDLLGRVTRETAGPGTPYEAQASYQYNLTNGQPGQQATQRRWDVKGVETITWLDGFNRTLKEERKDVDALGGDPTRFRPTYSATYNHLGQLTSETFTDWEGAKEVALTTLFEYDDWGEQYKATGPDDVARITQTDPIRQTLLTWTESAGTPRRISGKTRSSLNLFGKEDRIEALDAADKRVGERQYRYDGLGNCVEQIDEMGESTRFGFDLFTRVETTTLPDYTEIRRAYAAHSSDELPIGLTVIANETIKSIGVQTYDGLDRPTTLKVGPRLQQFFYQGGRGQVGTLITAANKSISYEYKPGLASTPVSSTAQDETASFDYDPHSALLTQSGNSQGEQLFDYDSSGHLRLESWKDTVSGRQWQTRFTHTLNGRPLTRMAVDGLTSTYTYDALARLQSASQGQIQATFEYDDLGQVCLITTRNLHTDQTLTTALAFDDQGREITRAMTLDGQPAQTITQTYRADNRLLRRELTLGAQTQLLEAFDYDSRGRMVLHSCEGPGLPKDRYGNGIREQLFAFDALDNVTAVYTLFDDCSRDEAVSTFAPDDPCQLRGISHSHPDYTDCTFEYDDDGNLLRDENGQSLHYDSQGRLLRVTVPSGESVSAYRYDAHNQLLGISRGAQAETLYFYDDERLSSTEQDGRKTHFLYLADQPLGQQRQDVPEDTLLLMTDAKHTVLAESSRNELRQAVYNAYGERHPDDDLECLLGFNGEVRDETSGWYLLGRGYRAYNPTLMRFHSPDSLSPFGAGGINPYVYCAGDPINFVDPTGHANRGVNWMGVLGGLLSAIGIALTVAAVVIAPPVGAAAVAFTGAFTGVGVGFGAYGVYEGVMATQATRLKDREKHATSSVISGGLDVAFGLFGLSQAVKAARKAAEAAKTASASKQFTSQMTQTNPFYHGRNAASDVNGAATRSVTSQGTQVPPPVPPKPRRVPPATPVTPPSRLLSEPVVPAQVTPRPQGAQSSGGMGRSSKWNFADLNEKQTNATVPSGLATKSYMPQELGDVTPAQSAMALKQRLGNQISTVLLSPLS